MFADQESEHLERISLLPAATKLGQGNIFTSVCQEFCPQGGGVSASVHAGVYPSPREQTPQSRQHPPEQTPLWTRHTPPGADPPGPGTPPWEQTPPDQAHPPGSRPPQTRHTPPGADTPPRPGTPPGSTLQHTVNERPVRILLECILVNFILLNLLLAALVGLFFE